ncbi:uncharacterized protein LOC117182319 isoform X2 [Belonocnema kinseyi]|nr:uncharacterized protein LOC117182319 isoform X2 [Belonocnema kinseyi]
MKTIVASLRAGPSLHLHEYNITDGSGRVKQRIHSNENLTVNVDIYTDAEPQTKPGKGASSAPSTARITKSKSELESGTAVKKVKGLKQQISGGIEGEFESVIFVEPVIDGATPTALGFKKLEDSVQKLQQQFQALEELSANSELIEKVRGNSTDPLTDMWQIININKRLDASEQGINKLTSILQDIIKGDKIEIQGGSDMSTELAETDRRSADLETNLAILYEGDNLSPREIQATSGNKFNESLGHTQITTKDPSDNVEKEIATQDLTQNKLSQRSVTASRSEGGAKGNNEGGVPLKETRSIPGDAVKRPSITMDLNEMRGDLSSLKNDISAVRKHIADLQFKIEELPSGANPEAGESGTGAKKAVPGGGASKKTEDGGIKKGEKSSAVETEAESGDKTGSSAAANQLPRTEGSTEPESGTNAEILNRCLETVQNVEAMYAVAIPELNNRVQELEKDVAQLMERVNNSPMGGVGPEGGLIINDLVTKIQNIQSDMQTLNETTNKILKEKGNLDTQTIVLQEQIELLKTVKADKEDLEDALADKADAKAVKRKVSYDQFDATCDDLTRGLEEAIAKLSQQESVWQQSLHEIQQEIGSKLDKVEISPLKEFVDEKIKTLQEKLKVLADMRQENEAAGTKKMLRDVQCLSCDKNVVMRMEESTNIRPPPMSCMKSIKPYLTYELNQIRKQKKLPKSRNMQQLEAALQQERKIKMKEKALVKTPRKHLYNRYCGGSHTVITPLQKIMRIGNFNNQWGPQVVQLSEGFIEGSDGKMYRSRLLAGEYGPKKQIFCEPCDNRCNIEQSGVQRISSIQQKSKENHSPVANQESPTGQKRASNASLGQGEKVSKKPSIVVSRRFSRELSQIQMPEEQSPPPPSPSTREPSLIKTVNLAEDANNFFRSEFEEDEIDELEE